ncbi:orotidine-5'-phosphate decarboxylase [bacterium SCSIO 12741]|nr:orotidine-5'-phosphate decarboxylase [bacterium SCSIO 12741]
MNRAVLIEQIKSKKSFLCVGLDPDLNKIPKHLLDLEDPVFEFGKAIVDATKDYCVAYKPNFAFYEALGESGMESLRKTLEHIPEECFTIADAKRGDIGNTAAQYAQSVFDKEQSGFDFDSITVAPYMGEDSVTPFYTYPNKWVVILGLTSNAGSNDFQQLPLANGKRLFEQVIETSSQWGTADNTMYVVGATRGEDIAAVRKLVPNHFFLVPGVGAQGGSLEEVVKYGMNEDCGLLINSSRGIIYAGSDENFAEASRQAAKALQEKMAVYL